MTTFSLLNEPKTKEDIMITIQCLRDELIRTGLREGLNCKTTIEISRKLDHYILQYQKLDLLKAN